MKTGTPNKSQTKYRNTARLMDEALIRLLEKKDFDYITVKEICETAGVHRSSFYLHYENTYDLLSECIEYMGHKILIKFSDDNFLEENQISNCSEEKLRILTPKYLLPYLEFVKENRKFFIAAITQPQALRCSAIVEHLNCRIFQPIMNRFGVPPEIQPYTVAFYLNGIGAIVIKWIQKECTEPPEKICDLILRCAGNTRFSEYPAPIFP